MYSAKVPYIMIMNYLEDSIEYKNPRQTKFNALLCFSVSFIFLSNFGDYLIVD